MSDHGSPTDPHPDPRPDLPTEEDAEIAEAGADQLPETVPDAYEQARRDEG
jgi:hypothetical protein